MEKEERFYVQIIKYGLVGVLNTLLTAFVIWVILFLFSNKNSHTTPSILLMTIANMAGYIVGVINSFILNRKWTFKSSASWKKSFVRFLTAFGICYLIQLGVVLWLSSLDMSLKWQINLKHYNFIITWAYVCQLVGIAIYFIFNFLLNKYYAFRVNNKYI